MTNLTRKIGRPIEYTEELGDEICREVSKTEKGLAHLCKQFSHWPCREAINEWRIKVHAFGLKYAKAKASQADLLVEQLIEIADDKTHDIIIKEGKNGEEYEVANNEFINRSRVRIDTRKWIAARLAPKFYGERIQQDVTTHTAIKTIDEIVAAYTNLAEEERLQVIDKISALADRSLA